MKHVYGGTELRSSGYYVPSEGKKLAGRPKGCFLRWLLGLVALVLVAGTIAAVLWAWHGRKPIPPPDPEEDLPALQYNPDSDGSGEYLEMDSLQANQLFKFVKNSPHVQGNAHYRELLEAVRFVYEADDDVVNAYAFAQEDAGADGRVRLEIHCNAGAARFARLIALGMAAGGEDGVRQLLEAMHPIQFAVLGEQDAVALLRQTGLDEALASANVRKSSESIAAGMLTFVLAHESGHQALGHVFGNAANLEVSRNQEREADTFASSVIATSPYGEYMFAGTLLWQYALAQQQEGSVGGGTHPLAKERLENLIRQNPDMAEAFGITADPEGGPDGAEGES